MNLAEVFVKIGIEDKEFNSKFGGITSKLGKLGSMASSAVKTTAKVVGATAAASGAAVVKIAKDAVASYGEYEQLVGGIKLSLGEAYDFVAEKAKTAYKDVQMSANDYMRQVNLLSTGLKESLNGDAQAAAELADKVIKAQADIVAAKGVSQESVENAFMGIMRGNFTMLDSLGIGLKGSKEGMEDVIRKVNEKTGTSYEMDNLADMQNALTDYVSLIGLSGYASAEASDTIQGSMAGAKAAWQDLLTAMANPEGDVKGSFDNLFTMIFGGMQNGKEVKGVADNMMPIFGQALTSIGGLIETKLPMILNRLPKFLEDNLPGLLTAVGNILSANGSFLKTQLPVLMDKAKTWIKENWPKIKDAVKDILDKVIDWAGKHLPTMAGDFGEAIGTFLGDAAAYIIPRLPEILGTLFDSALNFFTGIFDALDEKIPGLGFLLEGLTTIILIGVGAFKAYQAAMAISNTIQAVKAGITAMTAAIEGSTVAQNLLNAAMMAAPYVAIIAGIAALVGAFIWLWNNCEDFRDFWLGLWEVLKDAFNAVVDAISGWIGDIVDWFNGLWEDISDAWEGLKQLASDVCGAIAGFFSDIWNNMVESIEWVIGKIETLIQKIKEAITSLNPLKAAVSGSDLVESVKQKAGVSSGASNGTSGTSGGSSMYDPSARYKHYAKAMSSAYLLDGATIFGAMNGSYLEGGERGQEMIVGTDYLASMIQEAYAKANEGNQAQNIIIPVYIGQERITEVVVDAQNRHNYITGGR